jgi:hypothetical protein
MILTGNRGFSEWGDLFGAPVLAAALLDRLLHHAIVVQIEGASYRLREHADLSPDGCVQHPSTPIPPHLNAVAADHQKSLSKLNRRTASQRSEEFSAARSGDD